MTPTVLSEHLSRDIESVCRHLLPGGRKVGNDWCSGDVSGAEGRSLKVCLSGDKIGVGSDFATGETFGDLLDLWMAVEKVDLREAMARACSYLGLAVDGESSRPKRQYQRPEKPKSIRRLTESRVHEYLRSRGLTDRALEDFRVCEDGDWIVFPYLRDGVHLNTKYLHVDRSDGKKNVRQEKGAEPTLFGWHALETRFPNTRYCVITEGECFTGETQVLGVDGWISLKDYRGGKVAQWNSNGSIEFVYPLAKIEKNFSGRLVSHSSRQFFSLTTPNHNLISINKKGIPYKHSALSGPTNRSHLIPRCGIADGDGINLTDSEIALCLAVSADSTIDVRKMSYAGGQPRNIAVSSRYARFGFKKQRKIDRLLSLVSDIGISVSNTEIANGYRSICFSLPDWVPGRFLPWDWVCRASARQREFILSELIEWDGNIVQGRTMTEYSSKHIENAEWVQAMTHLSGRCSTIVNRKNDFGSWFKTTILNNKSSSSWRSIKTESVDFSGIVYCLQVQSGALVVRHNGIVSISGNCDAITLHQCGIPALSVPNGGGGGRKQDWIDSDYDHLQRFDALYLALDDDPAGKEAESEIVRRLGADRCRLVKLPHKDANECWQKGIRDFKRYLLSARALDPDELKPASHFTDRVIDEFYPSPGTHRGIRSPWSGWNLRFHRPELIVWVGFSGSGKSTLLNQVAAESLAEGERWCIASMEMPAADTLATIVRQLSGQERPSRERVTEIMSWLGERLWIFDLVGTAKADRMLEVFKYAVRRYNIKNFVIDSLTKCGIPEKEIDLQKSFAEAIVDFNRSHDCITHLVTHSRKLESEDRPPTKSDVRGSGALTDIAHTVIAVWRYMEPVVDESRYRPRKKVEEIPTIKPDTVLIVSKNRKKGWLGNFNLWFDPASRQFREDVAAPVLARFDRRPQRESDIDFD